MVSRIFAVLGPIIAVALICGSLLTTTSVAAGEDSVQGSDNVSSSLCWPNCAGEPPPEWRYKSWETMGMEGCWGGGYMYTRYEVWYLDSNRSGSYNSGEQTDKRNFQTCSTHYNCGFTGCR